MKNIKRGNDKPETMAVAFLVFSKVIPILISIVSGLIYTPTNSL
jgi:hypothetical protein